MRRDTGIEALCPTRTWHEDSDNASVRRQLAEGLQALERARPVLPTASTDSVAYTNHGGIEIVAPSSVRLSKMSAAFEPTTTFEHVCMRVTSAGAACILGLLSRFDSEKVSATFFDEPSRLLEHLSTFATPFVRGHRKRKSGSIDLMIHGVCGSVICCRCSVPVNACKNQHFTKVASWTLPSPEKTHFQLD